MGTISQREARRLRRRVEVLEKAERQRRRVWASEWPSGTYLGYEPCGVTTYAAALTARKLDHAVIVLTDKENVLRLVALPLAQIGE